MDDPKEILVAVKKRIAAYHPINQFTGEPLISAVNDTYNCFKENYNKLCLETDIDFARLLLELVSECLKILRNACACGPQNQEYILGQGDFFPIVNRILFNDSGYGLDLKGSFPAEYVVYKRICWQMVANASVQNENTQTTIWDKLENVFLVFEGSLSYTNIQLMLIYNMFPRVFVQAQDQRILKGLIKIYETDIRAENVIRTEYLHIFLEYILTKYYRLTHLYGSLDDHHRLIFLYYIADYMREDSPAGNVPSAFLLFLSKEFKKKSACILNSVKASVDAIKPREVLALLDVVALASGTEKYDKVYVTDHSLFLNIGGLLQTVISVGKGSKNIFTPMQQLQEVAPNSAESAEFENVISFELRSMLVRALANLLYRNKKNQDYARDMGIIYAILDCSSVDARNPLVKEWSILAIRNFTENNPENQEVIHNLNKIGDAPNAVLRELNFSLGSLRIQPSQLKQEKKFFL